MSDLISIIIPCFNAAPFIEETLESILSQKEVNFEVIIVDDGSTDNLKLILDKIPNPYISYFFQSNQGVSAARNNGYKKCNGNFIVFFDADDKMTPGFLKARYDQLSVDGQLDFTCGAVANFTGSKVLPGNLKGALTPDEILFYDSGVTTCPSNYMFRKKFIEKEHLKFNTLLSSTADRFFLIQAMVNGKCERAQSQSPLLYRISENSMSSKLTRKLVLDNELYYKELLLHKLIPAQKIQPALRTGYAILFKAFLKTGYYSKAMLYFIKLLKTRLGMAGQ